MLELAHPWVLSLFLPLLIWWLRIGARPSAPLPQCLDGFEGQDRRSPRGRPPGYLLRLAVLSLLVLSLAGPRTRQPRPLSPQEGLAIMIGLDLSGSMAVRDPKGEVRLAAARREVARFVRARTHDRIGLVTFGEDAVTRVPPTVSHQHLLEVLAELDPGGPDEGTAMGMGLGLAAHGVLSVPSPSRVVVLITDGRSNRGSLEPVSAAEAASTLGVRIHTVGVGGASGEDPLNEALLTRVASIGGGRYFRAEDAGGLRKVLEALDGMERGPVAEAAGFSFTPRHGPFLLLAVLFLAAEAGAFLLPRVRRP